MITKFTKRPIPTTIGTLLAVTVCVTSAAGRPDAASESDKPTATQTAPSPALIDQGTLAKRLELHRILDRATSEHDGIHDACGGLFYVGDESSVPHLIRVLKFFGDAELPLPPGVGLVCTQWHCVGALEKITGVKVGVSYASWKRWWEATHPGESLDAPPNKRISPAPGASPRR